MPKRQNEEFKIEFTNKSERYSWLRKKSSSLLSSLFIVIVDAIAIPEK
jgi:hypothetical protein